MGVSGNDDAKSCRFGFHLQLRQIVHEVNGDSAAFEHLSLRKLLRPWVLIHIAAHGGHWGDGCEFFENFRRAHIAGVNDMLCAAQGFDGLRPEEAVSIGDYSE